MRKSSISKSRIAVLLSLHFELNVFFLRCTGRPTIVQTNILIRSMGPISELDMVSTRLVHYRANISARYGQYKAGSLYKQHKNWIWSVQGRFIIELT